MTARLLDHHLMHHQQLKIKVKLHKFLEQFLQLPITLEMQIENFGEQMSMVVVDFLMSMECLHSIQENH